MEMHVPQHVHQHVLLVIWFVQEEWIIMDVKCLIFVDQQQLQNVLPFVLSIAQLITCIVVEEWTLMAVQCQTLAYQWQVFILIDGNFLITQSIIFNQDPLVMMEINVQLLAQLYVDLLTWFVQEELIIMDVKCLILVWEWLVIWLMILQIITFSSRHIKDQFTRTNW